MTRTNILTLLATAAFAISSFGQAKTPKDLADKFFDTYAKSPTMAIDGAFPSPCTDKMQERIKTLKSQVEQLKAYGSYIGNEPAAGRTEGNSVKIVPFIIKYDCHPIKFRFIFYKVKDDWTIADLHIDPEFIKL